MTTNHLPKAGFKLAKIVVGGAVLVGLRIGHRGHA